MSGSNAHEYPSTGGKGTGPSIPQGQPRESSFYCFDFDLIWSQAWQSWNSFIILVSYTKKKKKKGCYVSDGGSDGVLNIIILGLFIHKEPYQWCMMIYLYGLNVMREELWSKSYIHGRPWETLKVFQLHNRNWPKFSNFSFYYHVTEITHGIQYLVYH